MKKSIKVTANRQPGSGARPEGISKGGGVFIYFLRACPSHINTGFCRGQFELRGAEAIDCAGGLDVCPIATSFASAVDISRLLTLAWDNDGIAISGTLLQKTHVSLASIKRPRTVATNPRGLVGPPSAMRAHRVDWIKRPGGQVARCSYTSPGQRFA